MTLVASYSEAAAYNSSSWNTKIPLLYLPPFTCGTTTPLNDGSFDSGQTEKCLSHYTAEIETRRLRKKEQFYQQCKVYPKVAKCLLQSQMLIKFLFQAILTYISLV